MSHIRKYILEVEIPDIDPDPDTDYMTPYEFEDDEWRDRKGVINKDALGKNLTTYINLLYAIFEGIREWANNQKKIDRAEAYNIKKTVNRNLLNYSSGVSLKNMASDLKRLGIKKGESVEETLEERVPSNFFKKFRLYSHVINTFLGLAAAIASSYSIFNKLRKTSNTLRNDVSTRVKNGAIIEGIINPEMQNILDDILKKRIRNTRDLTKAFFKVKDKILKSYPQLSNYLTILS